MDKIYEDFTTKLLPQIQSGLVITKDYFIDLFGRYVKYLIVTDSLLVGLGVVCAIAGVILLRYGIKNINNDTGFFAMIAGGIMTLFSLVGFCISVNDLVKDIYVPEIRIYQEINYIKNNH